MNGTLKEGIERVYSFWTKHQLTHAVYVLNPLFGEFQKLGTEEEAHAHTNYSSLDVYKKLANTGHPYSPQDVYEILLKVNNGFKKDKYLMDALEIIRKKYGN